MELPGGMLLDGRLRRDVRFKPVTGELERAISDSGHYVASLPHQVSYILNACLAEVAGQQVDEAVVRSLCAGDRQYLMLQLEARLDPGPRWITARCIGCGELIQFQVQPGQWPFKPAGEYYPRTSIELSIGLIELNAPCGSDEEAIALLPEPADSMDWLLNRLARLDGSSLPIHQLTEDDRERIDQALDELSPQAASTVDVECPHCSMQQHIPIDPYAWIARDGERLDQEVHTLAINYHWSEREILQLTPARRSRYLRLIDLSRGRYSSEDLLRGEYGGGR